MSATKIATGGRDKRITIYVNNEVESIIEEDGVVFSLAFDEKEVLLAGCFNAAKLYNPNVTLQHADWVRSVAFAGALVATGAGTTARLWQRDGAEVRSFPNIHPINVIAVSEYLVTGATDGSTRLFDLDGRLIRVFRQDDEILALALNEPLLATGSADKTARVFNVVSKTLLYSLADSDGWVHAVAFFNGSLLTASADRTLQLWDEDTVTTQVKEAHDASIVALATHGSSFITGSLDKSWKLWTCS